MKRLKVAYWHRSKRFRDLLFCLWVGLVPAAQALSAGDEVVVVYNAKLTESKRVADYYALKRQVPSTQVLGLPLATNLEMSRAEFRDALQRPLAKALADKKLWRIGSHIVPATNNQPRRVEWRPTFSRIRYLVLCYGVPSTILADPNLVEPGAEQLRPELRRNEAAVDSELALLPLVQQKLLLAGPIPNPVYGTTNTAHLHPTNGVLVVSRLDGPSPEIARGLVDKALEAERDGLWGRTYFDLRNVNDPVYKAGDAWIRSAAEVCARMGFDTVLDEGPGTFPAGFPMSQIAFYAGWYDEHVSGPFAQPQVEFMPGAFAYHLHSYSAAELRNPSAHWVGPLLARGATITMGCVQEPFLSGTPDLGVFTARLMYSGFTFGEAAYASQPVLSWQTAVIGDPLYCPFARTLEQRLEDLQQRQSKMVEWAFLRLLNLNFGNGKSLADCSAFLEQFPLRTNSAALTEKLGDFYAAQGKPSSAVHEYLSALQLKPSPQQRLRLLLELGERLPALQRDTEAYDLYRTVLREYPTYPDKNFIYARLLALAQKLGKKDEAAQYSAVLNGTNQSAATVERR